MVIMSNPINDKLYQGRQDFCVVALTGVLGSGFEELDNLITDKNKLLAAVRKPEDLPSANVESLLNSEIVDLEKRNQAIQQNLFNRKYKICHKYAANNYASFKILKYNHVLWFYALKSLTNSISRQNIDSKGTALKDAVTSVIAEKYAPYRFEYDNTFQEYRGIDLQGRYNFSQVLTNQEWDELYNYFHDTPNFITKRKIGKANIIAEMFFKEDSPFCRFYQSIRQQMLSNDYYLYCMFNWRLGICLRATGDPKRSMATIRQEKLTENSNKNIWGIVRLMATLIKGYHQSTTLYSQTKGCRICIDSLRNSFEAKYLQERFSAFYLVNVLNDDVQSSIETVVDKNCRAQNDDIRLKLIKRATLQLYKKEASSEVKDGRLAMHDVDTCVANAEIHITYRPFPEILKTPVEQRDENWEKDAQESLSPTKFHYLAEQWMKFATLIQRPGLFTPDTDERCMQMAYTAKFNSGCISRQVGAVITNQDGSVRTIGWNDPPYGQVPCSLRDVRDLCDIAQGQSPDKYLCATYSDFELGGRFNDKGNFIVDEEMHIYDKGTKYLLEKFREKYNSISDENKVNVRYLPYPFCFKKCHTDWIPKEAGNSFHQRAIHAEENAMMQMVKYGGEALKGGIIYVTASPCEICSKKLYQIGVRKIIFIDPYPGIARKQVIENGLCRPELINYEGAYGATYFKLYSHFIDYKDELQICSLNI